MDRNYLYQCAFFILPSLVSAIPTAAPTTTSAPFPTMSAQDGFGVPAGGVGSTDTNGDAGGAAGGDNGDAWSISTGGIVGISVSIAVVVLAIGGMWWLWYVAKKRQWTIRETMKRASRRITGRKNPPRTPRAAPTTMASKRRTTMYNKPAAKIQTRDVDVERGQVPKVKPTPGWLAEEKERSRSRSREDEERVSTESSQLKPMETGGWKSKLKFGGKR